ncbi:MAG: SAM-dependent chlorinase/fluorinase [Polyangiaceae bacterium]
MRPVITLLTDFGTADPYVGMMKGVIATICPEANVVDVTHDVPPQDIRTGAFFLERSFRYFPDGTVHVAVVDPGVGTARKPISVRAGGHVFIGPDNGRLRLARAAAGRARAITLDRAAYFRPEISRTFHGRDLFSPVAAHLAAGVPFEKLGSSQKKIVKLADVAPRRARRGFVGRVVSVDRFGNLITNLDLARWKAVRRPRLEAGTFAATALAPSYGAVRKGELALILGGYGLLEIAARDASASKILGLGSGALVELGER